MTKNGQDGAIANHWKLMKLLAQYFQPRILLLCIMNYLKYRQLLSYMLIKYKIKLPEVYLLLLPEDL